MAEININKNDLEDIIKSYKRENDSFVFKSFTGSTDKKICTFIMNKKECKIQLFIKKKGTINILPMGNNTLQIKDFLLMWKQNNLLLNVKRIM